MSNRVLFALDGSERLEAVLPAVSAVAMGRDVSLELTSAMGRPPGGSAVPAPVLTFHPG